MKIRFFSLLIVCLSFFATNAEAININNPSNLEKCIEAMKSGGVITHMEKEGVTEVEFKCEGGKLYYKTTSYQGTSDWIPMTFPGCECN